ncbi:MAG: formate dehydrogenase subunit gamma [Planctomycetia bacterium]|nr:formate dehydrogenase subunit gamma [Planctomycetia bacterium]
MATKPASFDRQLCASVFLSLLIGLLWLVLLPAGAAMAADNAQTAGKPDNPGAQLWRDVRQRDIQITGVTQVKGMDAGVLVNTNGERWRRFRMEQLIPAVGVVLGAMLGLILLYHLVKRGMPVAAGFSGKYLHRFKEIDRLLHWSVALVFIFLAITGLILLTGRVVLIPLLGPELFAVLASASKEGHNLFGPLFLVGIIGLFIRFISKNFPGKGDIGWLLRAGGFLGGKHPTAGFFNMGEKIWFWLVMLVGLVISATGLILEFPFFGQDRTLMELALVLHGVGAGLLIAGSFGHIYVGTAGMPGSLSSMTTGYVDLNWARQHHNLWAEECEGRNEVLSKGEFERSRGQTPLGDRPEPLTRGDG